MEGSVEQGPVEDAAKAALGHAPKQAALQDAPKAPKQANLLPTLPYRLTIKFASVRRGIND